MKTTKEQRDVMRMLLKDSRIYGDGPQFNDVLDDLDELDALVNTAQTADFLEAVKLEAAHQVQRWGPDDREQKSDVDWIWLMTYLASKTVFGKGNDINGKSLARWIADATRDYANAAMKLARLAREQAQLPPLDYIDGFEKYRHRIITIAAAAKNWFDNRPFLSPEKRGEK